MNRLPVLISIPHGGTETPTELTNHTCITPQDLFDDSDPFTREIYDIDPWAVEVITTDIARAFVDLNRAQDDLPPKNPDGIIKSVTCYQQPIYKNGCEPDQAMIKHLIQHHYLPYHQHIQKVMHREGIQLALDCHSMAATPPATPSLHR